MELHFNWLMDEAYKSIMRWLILVGIGASVTESSIFSSVTAASCRAIYFVIILLIHFLYNGARRNCWELCDATTKPLFLASSPSEAYSNYDMRTSNQ